MATHQPKSFAEVSFSEAVARRVRLDLIVKLEGSPSQSRLISRLLAFDGPDRLVLDVPTTRGLKVFVPGGSRAGMAFALGPCFLQTITTVIEMRQYALHGTRRVEVLLVERPDRIISVNRREAPRHQLDPQSCFIFVSIWPANASSAGPAPAHVGRLINYSRGGMGMRMDSPLPCRVGDEMILRLEQAHADDFPIYRAILKHQTQNEDGVWLAGFGDVSELAPGKSASMIAMVIGSHE